MKRPYVPIFLLFAATILLSGCMPNTGAFSDAQPANFLHGVWHGWIAPISLIFSIFSDPSIRIYEVQNIGFWYDLGFYMAIISGFGGLSFFRKKKEP
ncbi:MAG TPA: hypothetical protein PLO56_02095 [Rhodothermales bacterium]|nr:hypothetical protein [Rhodothermales bacterium]